MNLSALASILLNIIAPIVIIAGLGFVLARVLDLDVRSLSRFALYFFIPALLFTQTYRARIGVDFAAIAAFAVIISALMTLITFVVIKLMRYDRLTASAFALSTVFVNAGNYGLPVVVFAFGNEGLSRAIIFFTVTAILLQTIAVFIAARGSASALDATQSIFKQPLVYAVSLGLMLNLSGLIIPEPLMKSLDLAGTAAVPVMLTILGAELSHITFTRDQFDIGLATIIKLVVAPVVAFGLAALMGLQGRTRAVCIVEASMPTAVVASILAVEFKARPEFVTSVVLVTTLGSIISLTVLLGILM